MQAAVDRFRRAISDPATGLPLSPVERILDWGQIAESLVDQRLVPRCRHGDWNLVHRRSWRIGVAMGLFGYQCNEDQRNNAG
jgi:hypothetical protein